MGRSNTDTGADQGMVYANDSRGRGKVVRPFLKVGKINSSSGSDHGKVVMVTLTSAYARACMFYDARFSSGFDFSLGGSSPGCSALRQVLLLPGHPPGAARRTRAGPAASCEVDLD